MAEVGRDRRAGDLLHRPARPGRAAAHHRPGIARADRRRDPARAAVVKAVAVATAVAALALVPGALACTPRASQAALESKLVCIECHTTLDESDSPFANELKGEVARRIALCQSEKQILDAMVGEFGPEVLSTPQTHGFDLIAWILPIGGILLGAAALAFGARHWSRVRTGSGDSTRRPRLTAEDELRVDEELARFDG